MRERKGGREGGVGGRRAREDWREWRREGEDSRREGREDTPAEMEAKRVARTLSIFAFELGLQRCIGISAFLPRAAESGKVPRPGRPDAPRPGRPGAPRPAGPTDV